MGLLPTVIVWTTAPVAASSSVTVSRAVVRHPDVGAVGGDAFGAAAHGDVWTTAPVEASSSLTVPPPSFATQTWVPSEETPEGCCPR